VTPLPNFDFGSILSFPKALFALEAQIRLLAQLVGENEVLTADDRRQLVDNIGWVKRFYEAAERELITND